MISSPTEREEMINSETLKLHDCYQSHILCQQKLSVNILADVFVKFTHWKPINQSILDISYFKKRRGRIDDTLYQGLQTTARGPNLTRQAI